MSGRSRVVGRPGRWIDDRWQWWRCPWLRRFVHPTTTITARVMGDDNKAGLVSRFSWCMKCVARCIYLLGGYVRQIEGGWVTWASMVATICPYLFSRTTTITARVMGDDNKVGLVSRFLRCMKCIVRRIYLHLLVIIQRCVTRHISGGGVGIRFHLCWLLNADARHRRRSRSLWCRPWWESLLTFSCSLSLSSNGQCCHQLFSNLALTSPNLSPHPP